jgi:hypothetical protein
LNLKISLTLILTITISLALGFVDNQVFAEETIGFAMAEDISAHLTFKFRDGIEQQEFAVFKTTDFVNGKWITNSANFMDAGESTAFQSFDGNYLEPNLGTSFQVQGVVANLPHLHKALDEAYKFRTTDTVNYNYKFFDIDVEFTHASGKYEINNLAYQDKGGSDNLLLEDVKPRKTLHYEDCKVADYLVGTQRNAYRSYNIEAETGFAIVETIEFECAGIRSEVTSKDVLSYKTIPGKINDFGKLDYKYAENIRTFVTFEFDNGIEKIEFPIFNLVSGFAEDDDPKFHVEGIVNRYPLLSNAIDIARDYRGIPGGANTDFNAKVEFVQELALGSQMLRVISFDDCNIEGSSITTYYENEEIYIGTGGAGILQTIDFDCAGIEPENPRYDKSMTTNEIYRNYNMASGPNAIAEFKFNDNTSTTIDFPIFRFQDILTKSNPTFQLEGMVGDYPLLYKQVDETAKINQITGISQSHELFDVDVNLKYGEESVIVFSYSDCRVIDYTIRTEHQNEEGFWRGLASENTFEFECQGFKPKIIDDGNILDTSIEDKTTTWAGMTFDGYLQSENVTSNLTFTFRDGVETHEYPVFKTSADFAENKGTSFQVQKIIADTPHLHKALEEAFKYRLTNHAGNFEYNYRFFDVDAVFTSNDESRKTFQYIDCQIEDYKVETLSHTHRGYLPLGTGFAIVETIDFDCNGVHSKITSIDELEHRTEIGTIRELPKLDYKYADDIHTYVTFEFDNGIEKIEFPNFKTNSGFGEDDDPSFQVEGIVNLYPLLSSAVANARDVRNLAIGGNVDFDVKVEFVQETLDNHKLLRGINYEGCHVMGSDLTTYYDKEEPFATVGGFAMNHSIDFDCAGMEPQNPRYDDSMTRNEINRNYNMASGIHAIVDFKFKDNTVETIDIPIFIQHNILSKSEATFQLKGIVGDNPLLYNQLDKTAKINQITGVTQMHELFDVDVNLKDKENTIRGFSYSNCRITDYVVATQHGNEESFFFWFALENTFEFECAGYDPKTPSNDTTPKPDQNNNKYWPDTQRWADEFRYIPRDKSN